MLHTVESYHSVGTRAQLQLLLEECTCKTWLGQAFASELHDNENDFDGFNIIMTKFSFCSGLDASSQRFRVYCFQKQAEFCNASFACHCSQSVSMDI